MSSRLSTSGPPRAWTRIALAIAVLLLVGAPATIRSIAPDSKRHTAPVTTDLMRADARQNRAQILEAARDVLSEQGVDASLREVARRAKVGTGTLYRHFPTRDALIEELVRQGFEDLGARAQELVEGNPPREALAVWLEEFAAGAKQIQGLPASLMATIADPSSPLHDACAAMRNAGGDLLRAAQDDGSIRTDIDREDLFALVAALSWLGEQESSHDRPSRLLHVVLQGLAAPTGDPSARATAVGARARQRER